jgi:hypothetical protein
MSQHEMDRQVKHRMAVLRHAEEVTGNVAMTCRYYGISRQAFYTWKRRYDELGEEGPLRRAAVARSSTPRLSSRAVDRQAEVAEVREPDRYRMLSRPGLTPVQKYALFTKQGRCRVHVEPFGNAAPCCGRSEPDEMYHLRNKTAAFVLLARNRSFLKPTPLLGHQL